MIDTETLKSNVCEFSHHSEPSSWSGCDSPHNMRRADAARYVRETYGIPCVATTLAKYACIGNGPVFRKAGKFPLYSRDDLDTWARSRLGEPVQSTSAFSVRSRRSRSG
jgi:hypothetical protein